MPSPDPESFTWLASEVEVGVEIASGWELALFLVSSCRCGGCVSRSFCLGSTFSRREGMGKDMGTESADVGRGISSERELSGLPAADIVRVGEEGCKAHSELGGEDGRSLGLEVVPASSYPSTDVNVAFSSFSALISGVFWKKFAMSVSSRWAKSGALRSRLSYFILSPITEMSSSASSRLPEAGIWESSGDVSTFDLDGFSAIRRIRFITMPKLAGYERTSELLKPITRCIVLSKGALCLIRPIDMLEFIDSDLWCHTD